MTRRRAIQPWERNIGFLLAELELVRLATSAPHLRARLHKIDALTAALPEGCPAWLAEAHADIRAGLAPNCPAEALQRQQTRLGPILERLFVARRRAIAEDAGETAAPRWTQRADLA